MRQAEARHPDHTVDVRFDHGALVLLGRLRERIAAEREAGVVDEDVDPAELVRGTRDEGGAALGIGDVQLEREVGLDGVDTAGAPRHACACVAQGARRRCPDPARRAGDDRGLTAQ
jgi:hypothetical protein